MKGKNWSWSKHRGRESGSWKKGFNGLVGDVLGVSNGQEVEAVKGV